MNYTRSLLLYQDIPSYGLFLKIIMFLLPVSLLGTTIYLASIGESSGSMALMGETLFVGALFWAIFPRAYQVYNDHIRIVLGGPFSIKIGFNSIKSLEATGRLIMSVNFATRLTGKYVAIVTRGATFAITPQDSDSFVANANQALNQWTNDPYRLKTTR